MADKYSSLLDTVRDYYTEKVLVHGATHRGVDMNSLEAQERRFEQLVKVFKGKGHFSVNDYGCGYGHLYAYLTQRGYDFKYRGFDISEEMIKEANKRFAGQPNCMFSTGSSTDEAADYTIASGIFNVRFSTPEDKWLDYVLNTLADMSRISKKGFAFNCLTRYSDREYMRDDLYYADPCYVFDYCKRNFSRNVALLHDYDLYDFTIIVRK